MDGEDTQAFECVLGVFCTLPVYETILKVYTILTALCTLRNW